MSNSDVGFHFHRSNTIGSRIVRWWTGTRYSHVSVEVKGRFYHATWSGGIYAEDFPDEDISVSERLPLSESESDDLFTLLEGELGKEYDKPSIIGQILKLEIGSNKRWYCSEMALRALSLIYPYPRHNRRFVNPYEVYLSIRSYKLGLEKGRSLLMNR